MLLTDLNEVKAMLQIDRADGSEDVALSLMIEQASDWIEEYLGRAGKLMYKVRTEYYDGAGTQQILLRARPVYTTPPIRVFVNGSGFYGALSGAYGDETELFYGYGFVLKIDQDDGSSRCGILIRTNNTAPASGYPASGVSYQGQGQATGYWPRPAVRQYGLLAPFVGQSFGGVKIIYAGGYTVDNLPSTYRAAANFLVAKMRYILPLGIELSSESYEERAISIIGDRKNYLMSLTSAFLNAGGIGRNWKW